MNSQPINRNTFFIYGALEDFCLLFGDVPAALSAFQLIGGIISARLFFDGHAYISTALVTSLLMLMLWMKGRPFNTLQSSFLQLLSLVYGFVAATSLLNAADSDGLNGYIGKSVAVKGIIIEEPFVRKEFWNTTVELQQINNYGCKGRIIAAWPADDSLSRIHKYGEEIELHGKLRRPMSARNPGAFDYRIYLLT
ncbi:MAG: DUF4131 domain-containing protein, partial [Fibrobacteres bacterium]|nr:DUF4131 domain-containing protein [Fibrobacterota bacterium]